ncbi:acyltransferase family protein [Mucilaginibacter sp. UYCu711]|uniref:acyltransferase family protein n=1 Tax=Mucilaginibacter sp. UYCu711 TaxID=3156339 RepID=UPI003D2033FE
MFNSFTFTTKPSHNKAIEIKKHIGKIDILRGIAILCVFFYHSELYLFPGYDTAGHATTKNAILNFIPSAYGWTGVQLFLIISGFLIHLGFMSRNESLNVIDFYSKRFWRIYPPYLVSVIIFCVTGLGLKYYLFSHRGFVDLLSHLFFVHDFSNNYEFTINPSFWSLALEMQLYLIYPIFLIFRKKLGINRTMLLLLFLLMAVFAPITYYYFHDAKFVSPWFMFYYWFTWCTGALLAERHREGKRLFGRFNLLIAFASFIATMAARYFNLGFGLLTCVLAWTAFFEWLLYAVINLETRLNKVLAMIGMVSYSIYLIHQPILIEVLPWFNHLGPGAYWAIIKPIPIFILIYIISCFTYKYIELPAIQAGYFVRKRKK